MLEGALWSEFRTDLKELLKPDKDSLLKKRVVPTIHEGEKRVRKEREIFVRIVPTVCTPDLNRFFSNRTRSGNAHHASSQRTIHPGDLTEEAFVMGLQAHYLYGSVEMRDRWSTGTGRSGMQ